jgi:DNA-binding SARP family transcriptional activator/tetratricopeptide (TPR) repeat protein
MTALRCIVRVLGPVEVVIDDNVQPLRPMARRLLAVLAASPGRVVRAERLMDDLWPEQQPVSAEKTLQTHVVHLRRAMGPAAIIHRAAGYLLNLDLVSLDALELERLVTLAEQALQSDRYPDGWALLKNVANLIRGIPFDEFAVDDFAAAEVARLSELGWRSVELAADCAVRVGNAASMVGPLERLVLEQPLRESAWSCLIGVLVASGRGADARRAGERAVAVLDHEFHAGPGPHLEHIISTLPTVTCALRSGGHLPRSLEALRLDTYIGRVDAQEAIASFLRAPSRVNGLVAVTGEPGIGKSSLLAAVASRFARDGGVVMFGRCQPETSSPLRPIIDLLVGDTAGDYKDPLGLDVVGLHPLGRSALLRCIDPNGSHDQPSRLADATVERDHLHAAIIDVLQWNSNGHSLLVMLDDVQWADTETLDAVDSLMNRTWESGFAVVVAARDESATWKRLVSDSIDHRRCLCVPLAGLHRDEVAAWVKLRFGDTASDDVSDAVHRQTDGNPLLVSAVMEDLSTGIDTSVGRVPSRVSLLVGGRLSRLDPVTLSVLHAASVAGTSSSTSMLATVLAIDDHAVAHSIASGYANHLLALGSEAATSVRFAHDLFRQAVYQSLPFDRRTELHESFAMFYRDRFGSAEAAADHWQRAGRPLDAARSFLAKAQRERAMLQRSSALESTTLGLDLAILDESAIHLIGELQYLKVALLIEVGRPDEAVTVIRQARQRVQRGTFAYVRLERLAAKMDAHLHQFEEARERLRHCLKEIAYLGGPDSSIEMGSEWCDIQIDLAWLRYRHFGLDTRTDADVQQTLDHVVELGTARQRSDLAQVAAALENRRTRFASSERALHLAHRSLLAAMELDDPILIADKTFSVGFQLLWLRRIDEAEERFRTTVAIFTDVGSEHRTLIPLVYLGVVSRLRGDVAATRQRAETALALAERTHSEIYGATCRANLGWCAWRNGDIATSRHELSQALSTWSAAQWNSYPIQGLALWPALALALRHGALTSYPARDLAAWLVAPSQQGLPTDVEGALTAGDFHRAVSWAVKRNLA